MTDLVEALRIEGNLRVNEKEEIFGNRKSREDRIADDLCYQAASLISQQDAELERLRREVEELRDAKWQVQHVDTMNDIASLRIALEGAEAALAEARKAAFIEAAEMATATGTDAENDWPGETWIAGQIATALRAKSEETRT